MATLRQSTAEKPGRNSVKSGASDAMEEKCMTASEVVEDIGFGPSNLGIFLFSAGGIWGCDGMELTVITVITMAAAQDLGVTGMFRGMLSTSAFFGLAVGVTVAGYFGDTMGRKVPIVYSYTFVALFGFVTSVLMSFWGFVFVRVLLGFSMGFGMPPALAMLSETTPADWRIPMRSITNILSQVAAIVTITLAGLEDPTLKHVNWRRLLAMIAVPTGIFGLLANFLLPESPVFLASVGRNEEADGVFNTMAKLNNVPATYKTTSTSEEKPIQPAGESAFLEQLRIVFSRRYWFITVAASYGCFFINVLGFGHAYAIPQVTSKTSSFSAAWLAGLTNSIAIVSNIIGGVLFQQLPRKEASIVALTLALASIGCFAYAGAMPTPRTPGFEVMFELGVVGIPTATQLGFIVFYQVAVEIYPTTASATGGSVVMGIGRVGTVIAPLLFEAAQIVTGSWTSFYKTLGVLSIIGMLLLAIAPPIKAYSEFDDSLSEDSKDSMMSKTAESLLLKSGYGALPAGRKSASKSASV